MNDAGYGARVMWRLVEPIHAVTYFSPEPLRALKSAGYRGFWMGYFAGRAAPLGAAPPELVHVLFYNFDFHHVSRALPDAWSYASPEAALSARSEGSGAALHRILGNQCSPDDIDRAAELASVAALSAPMEGRALFAANRALTAPPSPLARLWHWATLLREHRGDGHVAALTAAGVSGREAHVLHSLASGTPVTVYESARTFERLEWATNLQGLRKRGLVTDGGVLSDEGSALKRTVEDQTDALADTAYRKLTKDQREEFVELWQPMARAVVAAGEIPRRSPMGLNLTEI